MNFTLDAPTSPSLDGLISRDTETTKRSQRRFLPPDAQTDRLIRRLDVSSLRLFEVVCRSGSISKAAHTESLTASAISKRLKELEQTLGRELVQRRRDGIRPTRAGRVVLQQWFEIKSRLRVLGDGSDWGEDPSADGRLVIVCDERLFDFFSLDMLVQPRTLDLATQIDVYPTRHDVEHALLEASADVGLAQIDLERAVALPSERVDEDTLRLVYTPLAYVAIVRAVHPLACRGRSVDAADLLNFDLWPIGGAERVLAGMEQTVGRAAQTQGAPRWLRMSNALTVLEERGADAVVIAPVSLREVSRRFAGLRVLEPRESWARLAIEVVIPKDGDGFERAVDAVRAVFG